MGTESFDGREHRYVNYPITTVLHMMGQVRVREKQSEGEQKRKCVCVCVLSVLVCWVEDVVTDKSTLFPLACAYWCRYVKERVRVLVCVCVCLVFRA